jgi:phage anti-repressor protein
MNLESIETKLGQSVKATHLYDFLGLEKSNYSRFILKEILNNPYAEIEKDYSPYMTSENVGKKGNFRKEYYLHIDFAKKLCMVSRSAKGNEVRDYLVNLTKQIEDNELFNKEQLLFLSKLKVVFSYVSECKKSEQLHLNTHVEQSNSKNPFAEFHNMRNEILKIDPATIDERIKLYCIEHQRPLPKNCSKTEKLIILDKYEVLRNGVWDYLTATNEKQAMKLANLVKEMAMIEQTTMERVNDANLLRNKVELPKLQS